ncbi:unnamed protein product, partial [Laminaria digitata]
MALPVGLRRMVPVSAAVMVSLLVLRLSSGPAVGPPRDHSGIVSGALREDFFGGGVEASGDREGARHRALLTTGGVPGEGLLFAVVVANSDEAAIDEFGDEGGIWPGSEAGDGGSSEG